MGPNADRHTQQAGVMMPAATLVGRAGESPDVFADQQVRPERDAPRHGNVRALLSLLTSPGRGEVGPRERSGWGWRRFSACCAAVTPPRTAFGVPTLPLQGRASRAGSAHCRGGAIR